MEKDNLRLFQIVTNILILIALIYIGIQLKELGADLDDIILQGNAGTIIPVITSFWHI
jgi:hypothetical protein